MFFLGGAKLFSVQGAFLLAVYKGASEQVLKKVLFIRDETGSIYKALKLVKELFAGKSLHSIIQEIEKTDLKVKQEFRERGL